MGAQLRAVRRRIKSVQSTAKITRAQELIAASRIIRAQQRLHAAAPYARELTHAVEAVVSVSGNINHPLTRPARAPRRAAVVMITSDRGFCGGFNANLLREAQRLRALQDERGLSTVSYITGRKGISWHRFRDMPIAGQWAGFSDMPRQSDAAEITKVLLEAYGKPAEEGGVDEINVVYTEFVSMLTQQPIVRRLLPLEIEETEEASPRGPLAGYDFEPSPEDVLNSLLPWYVENRLFFALLESAASEIAARRRAMKSATDNAHELVEQLSREANKARQAEITQEISEIVGGANALAGSTGSK